MRSIFKEEERKGSQRKNSEQVCVSKTRGEESTGHKFLKVVTAERLLVAARHLVLSE